MREVQINSTVVVEAMLTASSADTTVVGFPTPSLPNHTCKPKYTALKEIHQLLTSNTALVQSNLGGGQNGYLSDDMSSKQVRTEVPVDGHTVSKYSFVSRIVDSIAARKSLFYH